ncbi:unnamed protein product [Heterobilharzia americana]|nr:unnamed protein product [Heterobilharzia americana]
MYHKHYSVQQLNIGDMQSEYCCSETKTKEFDDEKYPTVNKIWNPSFNFSLVSKATEVEKFFEVEFILTAPPASRQLYAVELGIGRVILGEICHCSITKVGTGINTRIPGMRLHTEYGLQKLTMLRTFATVHIGVLENPTTNNNNDYYIIFKVVVKARTDPAYPKFTATQMDTRLLIMKTPQEQRSVTFSIIDAAISPITALTSPVISLFKSEPPQSEPMVTYYTILHAEILWTEQVVYSPIRILLTIEGSASRVMEQKFVSIGRSLVTVVPINANMSIINNVGIIDIPSVYVNSTSEKYDKKLIISYVIKIIDATKFSAKLDVNVGVYVVTSRVNLSPIPASSPAQLAKAQIPYWAIGTLATSRSNTSLMLGAFNLLSFNIVIQPQARQSYKIQVYILQLLNIVTLMEPKILDIGSAVCTFDFQTTVSATNLEINMGPQYFESNETMTNSRSEKSAINFLVPLNVNLLASSFVTVRFTLFYGTQNVQAYVNVNVLKNEGDVHHGIKNPYW